MPEPSAWSSALPASVDADGGAVCALKDSVVSRWASDALVGASEFARPITPAVANARAAAAGTATSTPRLTGMRQLAQGAVFGLG